MSDQPQSGDGLVLPEAFPVKSSTMDPDTVRAAAQSLRSMGETVDTHMDTIVSLWSGLPAVYAGPGAEQAYGIMAPAATSSESLKETLDKAAKAIADYADAIEPVKTTLETLEQEAEAFRAEALAGYDGKPWREHQPAVDRNAELLGRYAAVVETLTTASTACANTINGLYTQSCPAVVEAISADAIMQSGEMMPWGAPVEKDRNCGESVVHGAGNFLKSTWDGAKAMVGFGPEGWSLDTLASTWVGVADFVGSTALLASPVLSQGIKFFGGDEVDKWVDERHDVAKTALGSFVGYDHQAAKEGGDGWHRWKEDGVAALTESVLNIGTCFIPGAGQAGAATKVGLAGTKVALAGSKVSTVASVVTKVTKVTVKVADNLIPGGGHLVEGVAKLVNVGADTVRGVDDVASVKPAKTPGAPTPHTPVTNTHGLGGGNRVVTNGPNLMQDVKAPKVPAAPVGDVADLAGEAGAKKAPKVATALDEADPTATTQRPRASDAVNGLDSSRAPESRAPEGAGARAPEMEQSRAPEADSVKASHTPESRAAEAETTRRPEGAGVRAPEVESSKLPEPDRAKTVDVEASRVPEVDTAKTPEASGAKAPEVEASRIPEAGKSPDVPEAERMPQEAGTRGTDAAAEVNPGRTPDAGDGLDAPEVRDGSAELSRAGADADEGLGDGAPEGTSPKDPNQWPGGELAPGAERRRALSGGRCPRETATGGTTRTATPTRRATRTPRTRTVGRAETCTTRRVASM
ncbi:MAG: hypothetical protein Q4D96_01455 [Propionibacteriaceae bacterium]|nr:hypothetical protein [Propionibacteriaceae bacterium]